MIQPSADFVGLLGDSKGEGEGVGSIPEQCTKCFSRKNNGKFKLEKIHPMQNINQNYPNYKLKLMFSPLYGFPRKPGHFRKVRTHLFAYIGIIKRAA